jgi:hypothetical protein
LSRGRFTARHPPAGRRSPQAGSCTCRAAPPRSRHALCPVLSPGCQQVFCLEGPWSIRPGEALENGIVEGFMTALESCGIRCCTYVNKTLRACSQCESRRIALLALNGAKLAPQCHKQVVRGLFATLGVETVVGERVGPTDGEDDCHCLAKCLQPRKCLPVANRSV